MESLFESDVAESLVSRIQALTPDSQAQWGTMTVAQMLAHCSVPFDQAYDPDYQTAHPRPPRFVRAILRLVVKPTVVGPKPYKRNMRTVPAFVVSDERDFAVEKARLIDYVRQLQRDGAGAFEGRQAHSFGPMTASEWNVLFHKHTDHHLTQFGV